MEHNTCYNLYSRLYTNSDKKEALVLMDDATYTKLLTRMADNKARILAFNLINDQNFSTILRQLKEPLYIGLLKDISQAELERAILIITIRNKKGAKQLAPLLLIATGLLSKICAQYKDVYSIGESIQSVDYYIHSFYKRYRPNNDKNKCPIYTPPKNVILYQLQKHLKAQSGRIMIIGLISQLMSLIRYVLVTFKGNRQAYWYKVQEIEFRIGRENFRASLNEFRAVPIDLRFRQVQFTNK